MKKIISGKVREVYDLEDGRMIDAECGAASDRQVGERDKRIRHGVFENERTALDVQLRQVLERAAGDELQRALLDDDGPAQAVGGAVECLHEIIALRIQNERHLAVEAESRGLAAVRRVTVDRQRRLGGRRIRLVGIEAVFVFSGGSTCVGRDRLEVLVVAFEIDARRSTRAGQRRCRIKRVAERILDPEKRPDIRDVIRSQVVRRVEVDATADIVGVVAVEIELRRRHLAVEDDIAAGCLLAGEGDVLARRGDGAVKDHPVMVAAHIVVCVVRASRVAAAVVADVQIACRRDIALEGDRLVLVEENGVVIRRLEDTVLDLFLKRFGQFAFVAVELPQKVRPDLRRSRLHELREVTRNEQVGRNDVVRRLPIAESTVVLLAAEIRHDLRMLQIRLVHWHNLDLLMQPSAYQ